MPAPPSPGWAALGSVRLRIRRGPGAPAAAPRRHRSRAQAPRAADEAAGLAGAFLRRGWRGGSTRQDPRHTPAPDLVNRNFTATGPNRLWVADATRIPLR